MLSKRKGQYMKKEWRLFFLVLIFAIVVFILRIYDAGISPVKSAGLVMTLLDEYTMGGVYDRNDNLIVQGEGKQKKWEGTEEEQVALASLFGPDITVTNNSRMTIWGMSPYLFGFGDNRLNLGGLLNPQKQRIGGNVKLTIDKNLQTYIYRTLRQKGYKKGSVVISNWKTGEILAAVSLPSFNPTENKGTISNVFNKRYAPGSTMKPILAAAAISVNPELAGYIYNCSPENHTFYPDKGEACQINCAYNSYHGKVGMEDAIAYSCNGYFISLLQQVPKEKLAKELRKWGFDSTVSFDQFDYWDQTFQIEGGNGISYLLGAIGQGNSSITPIGLNLCTNVLLNSGTLEEPRLIEAESDSPESEMKSRTEKKSHEVCDSEIADTVCEMMLGVTEYGTGSNFYLPNFAAKTGTAEKANKKGELTGKYTVWTTGGLTLEEFPYSITVCLDDVDGDIHSSYAGEIAKEILEYMK